MFGHQNDNSTQTPGNDSEETSYGAGDNSSSEAVVSATVAGAASNSAATDQAWQHPGTPLDSSQSTQSDGQNQSNQVSDNNDESLSGEPQSIDDVISPAGGYPKKPSFQFASGVTGVSDDAGPSGDATELVNIKRKALTELAPLIDKLDQSPEEKFRTLMMLIQASDDQALVKAAYAAAHSISNEKERAQALLDIVNEINYFTQQPQA